MDIHAQETIIIKVSCYILIDDTVHVDNRIFHEDNIASEDDIKNEAQQVSTSHDVGSLHDTKNLHNIGISNYEIFEASSGLFNQVHWAANVSMPSTL